MDSLEDVAADLFRFHGRQHIIDAQKYLFRGFHRVSGETSSRCMIFKSVPIASPA
jgi:hypothetical protein